MEVTGWFTGGGVGYSYFLRLSINPEQSSDIPRTEGRVAPRQQ